MQDLRQQTLASLEQNQESKPDKQNGVSEHLKQKKVYTNRPTTKKKKHATSEFFKFRNNNSASASLSFFLTPPSNDQHMPP
jgi:hypothetical protein